jgi:hypothetical protein
MFMSVLTVINYRVSVLLNTYGKIVFSMYGRQGMSQGSPNHAGQRDKEYCAPVEFSLLQIFDGRTERAFSSRLSALAQY